MRHLFHFVSVSLLSLAVLLSSSSAGAESLEIRLVSYNVYMVPLTAPALAERLERLPEKIGELKPDVVMLQEVWAERDSASLEESLRSLGLTHVFRAAAANLIAYDSSGMIIASRFPIKSSKRHSFSLGRRPHTPYHLDWIGRKGALDVQLETPLGLVRFINTHFQASYQTGSYESVRVAQSLEMASWLEDDTLPLILGGDFNARPHSVSCRVLRQQSGVRLPKGRWRVDQVLLRDGKGLSVESLEMKRLLHVPVELSDGSKRRLSDHRAIFMRLGVSKKADDAPAAATPGPFDPMLRGQAEQVLRNNLRRTRRQRYASYASLAICFGLGLWGTRRLRKMRGKKKSTWRWAVLVAASTVVGIWVVYFMLSYVPHRRAGIERALVALSKAAS